MSSYIELLEQYDRAVTIIGKLIEVAKPMALAYPNLEPIITEAKGFLDEAYDC